MNKKKVLHVSATLGNIALFRLLLLNKLVEDDWTTLVAASNTGNSYADELVSKGHQYFEVKTRNFNNILGPIKAIIKIVKIIKENKISVVHTHTPSGGTLGRLAAIYCRVPTILHTTGGLYFTKNSSFLIYWSVLYLERILSKFTNYIFSVNREDIETMIRLKIRPKNEIVYSGPGGVKISNYTLDNDYSKRKRKSLGLEKDNIIIGYVARLVKEKGTEELLKIIELVLKKRPSTIFIIVGKGQELPEFEQFIAKNNLGKNLKLLGWRNDINELMFCFDLFVFPSHREGLPVVVIEAMSAMLPVVSFDIRGCREAIVDGETGFIVPFKDIDKIVQKICILIDDKNVRLEMGKMGRKRVIQEYLDKFHVERQMIVYKSIQ